MPLTDLAVRQAKATGKSYTWPWRRPRPASAARSAVGHITESLHTIKAELVEAACPLPERAIRPRC